MIDDTRLLLRKEALPWWQILNEDIREEEWDGACEPFLHKCGEADAKAKHTEKSGNS